jgi:UDP-3-O-[3-hydroxymyristoyl] glucosamine N-acyltransferase
LPHEIDAHNRTLKYKAIKMTFPASQIALLINGKVEGDPNVLIASFGKIEEAKQGQLSFFSNPKYEDFLYTTSASAIIINDDYELKQPVSATLIRVENAYSAFAVLLSKYQEIVQQQLSGVEEPSYIHPSASYGNNVFIGAFSYLGENVKLGDNTKIFPHVYLGNNVSIGNNCIIYPGAKIYHDCELGNNVIIHAGTVIGSDGFGFAPLPDGSLKKVPQIGNVVLEDNVEIGANSTIDRATMGSTIIRKGAKLDNLIQVGHNAEIGQSTVIAAQAGVSGSTKIGNGVMIGGQAGIVGHIQLGDGARVNAQSGVTKSVDAGKSVTGSPAFDYTAALRSQAAGRKLPELEKRVKQLEDLIKQLLEEKTSV